MQYFSPDRPQLANGIPCWTSCPTEALPSLCVWPLADRPDHFDCRLLVSGRWAERELHAAEILLFLHDWREDPEQALRAWFRRESPSPTTSKRVETERSIEELGL